MANVVLLTHSTDILFGPYRHPYDGGIFSDLQMTVLRSREIVTWSRRERYEPHPRPLPPPGLVTPMAMTGQAAFVNTT